jgi:hypothetical protein
LISSQVEIDDLSDESFIIGVFTLSVASWIEYLSSVVCSELIFAQFESSAISTK